MIWTTVLMTIWLISISIMDIRSRRVPAWLLASGSILAGLILIYQCSAGERIYFDVVKGLLPGVILLLVTFATKNAGYGDGVVMLCVGMISNGGKTLLIFGLSLAGIAVCSLILLVLHKVGRNTRMPYLPFLTAAWLIAIKL